MRIFVLLSSLTVLLFAATALPCSTIGFVDKDRCLLAKNYDWHLQHGMIIANPKLVSKTAYVLDAKKDKPMTWVSTHGSVTFNQYGREFPVGGMNDAGLAIEVLLLDETIYSSSNEGPAISELQWVQYHLDRWSTVQQMEMDSEAPRIAPIYANVHYLACDATGDCATFEYLEGNLVPRRKEQLPYSVLTNDMYQDSLTELANYKNFGGPLPIPTGSSSLDRFVRAADYLRMFKEDKSRGVEFAFQTLKSVRYGWHTKWFIVYDLKQRKIAFQSLRQPKTKWIDIKKFSFACKKPSQAMDINTTLPGDITGKFFNYTLAMNRDQLRTSIRGLKGLPKSKYLPELPSNAEEVFATYPSQNVCTEGLREEE